MHLRIALLASAVCVGSGELHAACAAQSVEALAKEIASAYASDVLGSMDHTCNFAETFEVRVEHSLREDEIESSSAKSFGELDSLLRARRIEGFPVPATWPLLACSQGTCSFGGGNQMHNHLFLKSIHYRKTPQGYILLKIVFEDGD
jgi:hypothetical protein